MYHFCNLFSSLFLSLFLQIHGDLQEFDGVKPEDLVGDEESGRRSPGSAYGSPSYNGSQRGGGSLRGGSQKTTGAGSISSQHLFKSPPSSSKTGGGGAGGAMSSERDNHSNSHSTPQAEGKDYNDDNRTTSATPSPGTYLSPCYNILPSSFESFFLNHKLPHQIID